ncbi:MAG: TIGR04372 family glycosyltransferase [Alphaproteobacteria bacterium]|nr:TIGR04372 family glycosyltransferase [Alphaproteobacteria bacterium]
MRKSGKRGAGPGSIRRLANALATGGYTSQRRVAKASIFQRIYRDWHIDRLPQVFSIRRLTGYLVYPIRIAGRRVLLVVYRRRSALATIAALISPLTERAIQPYGSGYYFLRLAHWLDRTGLRPFARLPLAIVRYGLALSIQAHLGARQYQTAIKTARLLNLLFRPNILNQANLEATVYYQTLYFTQDYERIAHDFRLHRGISNYYLALIAGIAHLYRLNIPAARHYLSLAAEIHPDCHLTRTMLGRAYLMSGDYSQAASCFYVSAALEPRIVMGHQNYAGRYDILKYKPHEWELRSAGYLMIYDNLVRFAEDLFLQGRSAESFRFYNKALSFQKTLATNFSLPDVLLNCLQIEVKNFDPSQPVRILSYEWVTQFGHIGLLGSYRKMVELGELPRGNHLLLAPENKVSNAHYLSYWEPYFSIVRSEVLVNELFPYQRFLGDQFMALPSDGPVAEPWTRAAARAQMLWANQGRPPLLQLSERDKHEGHWKLSALGLPKGAWYVALHVREGGFYRDGTGTISEHRSAEIEDYFGAIEEITSRGGWVIRMGDASMKPLPEMPNVIDYAHSDFKSEQMDIFLLATARFVIGTTSGLTTVAMTFGTPMLLVNCISNDWQIWTDNTDFALKRVYDRNKGRYLSLRETYREPMQSILVNHAILRRRGYEVHNCTPEEIRAAVSYKLKTLTSKFACVKEDHPLMRQYRLALAGNPYMFGAAKPVLPFLEAYPELLETADDCDNSDRSRSSGLRA